MSLSGTKVKLQPSDDPNATVEVPIEAAHMSHTIKNMLDGLFIYHFDTHMSMTDV